MKLRPEYEKIRAAVESCQAHALGKTALEAADKQGEAVAWIDPEYKHGKPYAKGTLPVVTYPVKGFSPLYTHPQPDRKEQGEPVGITLTGKQLRNAIEFVNPDGVGDLDQLECEVTIRHFNDAIDGDGEPMPSGIYAYLAEYPEEGRVSLDADLAPRPDRKAIEDEVIERCAKICSQISLDIQMQGESLSGCTSYIADRCAEVIRALKGSK